VAVWWKQSFKGRKWFVFHIFFGCLGQIVPSTLKRQPRAEAVRPRPTLPRSEGSRPAEDRAAYRRAPGTGSAGPDKKADVGAGTGDVEFRGGFGRGRGVPQ
ncbi:40S ribosomal protein S10b-like, partial [Cryptotermes secundus]|uniref:40S ribosomal protein S10b-like n=1 Tax=Cryptotermes secundus TaxID=105785 RepID=UPI000CD7C135